MFEQASKRKLRFETQAGNLTTEDLWDLPLLAGTLCLDDIAKDINRELKDREEESFVQKKSGASIILTLKMNIVKHVIAAKLQAAEDSEKRAENKALEQKILSAIANKEDEKLGDMSVTQLKNMLKKTAS